MNLLLNILQSASIIIASFVAIYGITSWRRETKWRRKYELAEEVLALFYECREKYAIIRSPFSTTDEGKSRKRADNETHTESELWDRAYVFFERYEKVKSSFIKLSSLKYRFITHFGKETEEPFLELTRITNTILSAARRLGYQYWPRQGKGFMNDADFQKHLEDMQKAESIVWSDFSEPDEINGRINRCVERIEIICSRIIKG